MILKESNVFVSLKLIYAECFGYYEKITYSYKPKRKEENWDEKHRLLTAEANRKLTKDQNGNKGADNLTPLEKLDKEETEAILEVLQTLEKKYKDLGPLLDCVVWHDGTEWRVSLSTEDLDSDSSIVLGEFTKRQEFAALR